MPRKKTPDPPRAMLDLGALIRNSRKRCGLSQKQLMPLVYEALGHTNPFEKKGTYIKEIDEGRKVPDLGFLLAVYWAIRGKEGLHADKSVEEIKEWLVTWSAAKLGNLERAWKHKWTAEYWELLRKAASGLTETATDLASTVTPPSRLPTIDQFPGAFSPLIIITGTSQTPTPYQAPERIEELFRNNAGFSDITYLSYISPPPKTYILTDRAVITLGEEERRNLLGNAHILSIGGPQINVVTRHLCRTSVFTFDFHYRHEWFTDIFDYLKGKGILTSDGHVALFYKYLSERIIEFDQDLFEDSGLNKSERKAIYDLASDMRSRADAPNANYGEIMEIFRPKGTVDPIKGRIGSPPLADRDIGMVTVGPNPWDLGKSGKERFQYTSIIAAGFHELGTAYAVKSLAKSTGFRDYPLGGFMKVTGGHGDREYDKFIKGRYSWDPELTPPYTVENLLEILEPSSPSSERVPMFTGRSESSVPYSKQTEFVRQFLKKKKT